MVPITQYHNWHMLLSSSLEGIYSSFTTPAVLKILDAHVLRTSATAPNVLTRPIPRRFVLSPPSPFPFSPHDSSALAKEAPTHVVAPPAARPVLAPKCSEHL